MASNEMVSSHTIGSIAYSGMGEAVRVRKQLVAQLTLWAPPGVAHHSCVCVCVDS